MSINIDRVAQGLQPPNVGGPHAKASEAAAGSYRGETVKQGGKDVHSLLADAAEEMTFAAGEKRLSERKPKSGTNLDSMAAELAEKYLRYASEAAPSDGLAQFIQSLKRQGQTSSQELRRQLGEQFEDVGQQHAALSFLEQTLEQEGGSDALLSAVRQARRTLEAESGPEIRAAYQQLQTATAEHRPNYEEINQAHADLLQRYGASGFDDAAAFLIRSVGQELERPEVVRDPQMLKALVDHLYFVQVARNTVTAFNNLLGKLDRQFGVRGPLDGHALMKEILPLKDQQWINVDKLLSLPDRLGCQNDEQRIYCLREMHTLVRLLPEKAFASLEDRQRLTTATLDALSRAVDAEEVA